nr:hypothetical protein BaRGS_022284 [Batillaria attramentaria]
MSGGFTPRIDEVDGQKSYMEMLREDEDDDAMVVEEISEIPLLTAPEIKQEPSDVEDAMFLQEVESCTPQLEELVQKNQKHAKENGDGAEETEAEVSGTAQFFELGSGKLGLASGPFVLKASDATVPKARARGAGPVVNGIGRSYTMSLPTTKSVTFVSPWSVAAETPAVSLSRGEEETNPTYIEIIGPEQHGSVTTTTNSENFKTPPNTFTRRRAVSESAVSYSSRSAPDRMTTISDDWAEMLRSVPVPQRAHSLPAGYIPEIDQVIEVDADTTGHATLDGDVIEVVEVLNETEGVEGRWEVEETADQLSIDTPGQPDILVTQAEIPSTPSTPSTPTSTVSSKAIFVNSSITLEDPEDAARVELPMDDVITISGVIVQ